MNANDPISYRLIILKLDGPVLNIGYQLFDSADELYGTQVIFRLLFLFNHHSIILLIDFIILLLCPSNHTLRLKITSKIGLRCVIVGRFASNCHIWIIIIFEADRTFILATYLPIFEIVVLEILLFHLKVYYFFYIFNIIKAFRYLNLFQF